jgi:tyrosinase
VSPTVPATTAAVAAAQVGLRHRRSVRRLSAGQLDDLRQAISAAQKIGDDRGYQYWVGIHGLPLPMYCQHTTRLRNAPLFLPWHRAYLYFFEKALQERVPGVTLPWWDWTVEKGTALPGAYRKAPLASSPIQPSGRRDPNEKRTQRKAGQPSWQPSQGQVDAALGNSSFGLFQSQLEEVHNSVHGWVGGTMGDPKVAAYDPIFWAHHTMIDRLWYLWQLEHSGFRFSESYLETALPPFPMTVRQTLDITRLGYDYAAATAAVAGTRRG